MGVIIISAVGLIVFLSLCPCRVPFEDSTFTRSMSMPQDPFSSRAANQQLEVAAAQSKAVRNSESNLRTPPNDTEKAKLKVVNGIVSSPDNPATVRRLSQDTDSSITVSWHKRVVVHRVPRSDASRSMFVSSSQSKEGLSS